MRLRMTLDVIWKANPFLRNRIRSGIASGNSALRNRVAVASFVAIMIALLVGTTIALWQAHEASLQRE